MTYDEAGITGYNFAISYRSAMTSYYQLMYALEYHDPKLVICDFCCLFDDQRPSDIEKVYRKVADCMPDKKLKNQMIREICREDKSQSYLSWKYPMLRYHSMWSKLSGSDFEPDYQVDDNYPVYKKGALLRDKKYDGDLLEVTPELWNFTDRRTDLSEFSVKYYDRMIDECHNRGIEIVAVLPPKISAAGEYAASWETQKEYFDSRGVGYLNYNTYEQIQRIGLNLGTDYYNAGHLNVYGSIKFSRVLAHRLRLITEEMRDINPNGKKLLISSMKYIRPHPEGVAFFSDNQRLDNQSSFYQIIKWIRQLSRRIYVVYANIFFTFS